MTYEEREAIFAKEALNGADIVKLTGLSKGAASEIIQKIKRNGYDRLGVKGYIHIQDYLDFFKLPLTARYQSIERAKEEAQRIMRSVNAVKKW